MTRKFVQVIPHQLPDDMGIALYAIADDGTAWRSRQFPKNTFPDEPWEQIPELPEIDQFGGAI